jgi:hypothetical protein
MQTGAVAFRIDAASFRSRQRAVWKARAHGSIGTGSRFTAARSRFVAASSRLTAASSRLPWHNVTLRRHALTLRRHTVTLRRHALTLEATAAASIVIVIMYRRDDASDV